MTRDLCALTELDATGAREVVYNDETGARVAVFVIKQGDDIVGYVNSCPHARLPLNWRDDMFFDVSGRYILCANHSAYFDIPTGQCVRGPCKGKSLTPYPVSVNNGRVVAV